MLHSLPRSLIRWFPTVNDQTCAGDRDCFNFCRNDVFIWDDRRNRPVVNNPSRCALGCDACAKLCPHEAISFPTREFLRSEIQRVRFQETFPDSRR